MKQLSKLFIVALLISTPISALAQKIGVINIDMALKQSRISKIYYAKTKKHFQSRVEKVKAMDKRLKALGARIKKAGATLSVGDSDKLKLQYRQQAEALQLEAKQLRADTTQADRKALAKILPILRQSVQKLAQEKSYDLIIDHNVVAYFTPANDITKQVIALMNKHKS